MSKIVKIPTSMSPFVVMVNGHKYVYPAGETVEVPDHVAHIIEQHEKCTSTVPAVPATEINMVSAGGKAFVITVSDEGVLAVAPKITGATFTFLVDGMEYTAEVGMKWGEWVNSEYNASAYTCENCGKEYHMVDICEDGLVGSMNGGCDDCPDAGDELRYCCSHWGVAQTQDDYDGGNFKALNADDVIDPTAYMYTMDW